MAFMLPTGLLYLLVKDLLAGSTSGRSTFYLVGCVACFVLILLTTWFQYNGTYFTSRSFTRRYSSPVGSMNAMFWNAQARTPFTSPFAPSGELAVAC